MVIWVTGRSGAGKTTHAKALRTFCKHIGQSCIILDGDNVRKWFPSGFTYEHRQRHLQRITNMAKLLDEQVDLVVIACVSPIRHEREFYQAQIKNCMEVYLPGGAMWEGTTYEEPLKKYEDYGFQGTYITEKG